MDRAKLITSKGELVQGTCDWVTKKIEFTEWRASEGGLLWISGGPGLGKTMLSIYLTEHLSSYFSSLEQSYYSTYFFCDAKDNTRNNAVAIVRGILFQLLKQKGDLIEHVRSGYEVQREQLFQPGSFEALWDIFLDMTSALRDSQVYCILDGLDECEPNSLEPLLIKLSKITTTSPLMKIIILSREYPRCLEVSLGQSSRIRLDPDAETEISEGLYLYISTRVAELSRNKQYPPELTKSVKKTLKEKSMGTYLWVSFVIKDLCTMEISDVEETLRQLPRGLNALYERILEQIEPDHRDLTLDILRWCTFAVELLQLEELAAALRIQPTELLDSTAVLRGKLTYCGHFINITGDFATLVHQSARDFLTGRISDSRAVPWFSLSNVELEHSRLTSACIVCICDSYEVLLRCDMSPLLSSQRNTVRGCVCPTEFARYACRHWCTHFSSSGQQISKILDEYPQFFSNKSQLLKDWPFIIPFSTSLNGVASIAAIFGLPDLLQQHLEDGGVRLYLKDLFAARKGLTLIHIASAQGHLPIVEMLIKNKFCINNKDKDGNTPLYYAAEGGHFTVVKTLLTNGAHIDRGHEGRTPLFAAVRHNNHEIAEHLLISGAKSNDTNLQSSPMGAAIISSNIELVKLLIRWGADAHYRDRDGWSTLGKALYVNSELLVFFLKRWTKRFCDKPSRFRDIVDFGKTTALHVACRGGDLPAIHLLVDPKWSLDLNFQDENGNTALYLAVEYRKSEAVKLLLAQTARVDPTLVNNMGFSPIYAALIRPQMAVIRRLLEEPKVSLLEPSKNCRWSPIHLLTVSSSELVRARRERWAPDKKWHYYWNSYSNKRVYIESDLGDYCGKERAKEALQLLVKELGVDPQLRTPHAKRLDATWHNHHFISLASRDRYDNWRTGYVVEEPSHLSPWLNPPDFCYETPLSLAIRGGYVSTVEYFLEHCNIDPNVSCRGCDDASPLHVAAQSLREDVVDILISKWKVDVHCVDNHQRTPLHSVAGALSPTELDFNSFGARNRIIYALFKAGAKTSATDINGHTPRDLFVSNKHFNREKEKEYKEWEFNQILEGVGLWGRYGAPQSLCRHAPDGFRGYMAEFIIDHTSCDNRYVTYRKR